MDEQHVKHSSGDLHSRLKTRKILGVGEIDNGDIHRSKISQLLGHNEHLYVKFPRGFWMWHLFSAVIFTVQGLGSLMCFSILVALSRDYGQSTSSVRTRGNYTLSSFTFNSLFFRYLGNKQPVDWDWYYYLFDCQRIDCENHLPTRIWSLAQSKKGTEKTNNLILNKGIWNFKNKVSPLYMHQILFTSASVSIELVCKFILSHCMLN
uniref:Tumor protein p53-inducible protein 11 n=1 Tax=Strigamia maritima TaxID=126957 RepID=T1JM64_STRMM